MVPTRLTSGHDILRDGEAARAAILGAVAVDPGIHKSALVRTLDMGWGTLNHHLRRLRKDQAVRLEKSTGREVRVFPSHMDATERRWLAAMREDAAILGALRVTPDVGVCALSDRVGLDRRLVRRHLLRLSDAGIVEATQGRKRTYTLAEDAHDRLEGFPWGVETAALR